MSSEVTILAKVREEKMPKTSLFVRVFDLSSVGESEVIPQEIDSYELHGNTDFLSREFDRFVDGTSEILNGAGNIEIFNKNLSTSVIITGDNDALLYELFGKIRRRWL